MTAPTPPSPRRRLTRREISLSAMVDELVSTCRSLRASNRKQAATIKQLRAELKGESDPFNWSTFPPHHP